MIFSPVLTEYFSRSRRAEKNRTGINLFEACRSVIRANRRRTCTSTGPCLIKFVKIVFRAGGISIIHCIKSRVYVSLLIPSFASGDKIRANFHLSSSKGGRIYLKD